MRYIEIKDEKLIELVKKKYALVEETVELKKDMDVIRDKGLAINLAIGETKDSINEMMKVIVAKEDLDEFEEESSTELIDGVVQFGVIDKLANAKVALKRDKENRDRLESEEFTPEELVDKKQAEFANLAQTLPEKGLRTEQLGTLLDELIKVIK